MASELIPALKQLKLYGMAAACEELLGERPRKAKDLSLIHISEPTRL